MWIIYTLCMTQRTQHEFRYRMQDAGMRPTQERLKILAILSRRSTPIAVDELELLVGVSMHRTTLYRSLQQLVGAGIVYQTDFRQGKAFFEIIHPDDHHHHIVCTTCKRVSNVSIPALEQSISSSRFLPKEFARVTDHMISFFGVCKKCTNKRQ
jgi:Fur family transcriptional regulator, ferric uptake regulator